MRVHVNNIPKVSEFEIKQSNSEEVEDFEVQFAKENNHVRLVGEHGIIHVHKDNIDKVRSILGDCNNYFQELDKAKEVTDG
jgi:hypothetical protein